MNTRLVLTGLMVLCIVTVSGQGYHVKTIQNHKKSWIELQSYGLKEFIPNGYFQGNDNESFPEAVLKSATVKQRLDSVIYYNTSKYEYNYEGNELQYECNHYIRKDNLWKLYMKWKYFYNESGKIFKTIVTWYEGQGWVHELLYFYNADGRVKELTIDAGAKLEFTWDTKGNLTKLKWYNNDGADYDYETYAYDAKGNLAEITAIGISGAIIWHNKYIYDTDNRIKQANNYDFATGPDTVYYDYDINDNLITKTSFWWNNNVREVLRKSEYTYDNSYSFSDLILPVSVIGSFLYPGEARDNIYFNHKLLISKDISKSGWQNSVKYYYSDFPSQKGTSSFDIINKEVVGLYPNPVSDKLYFDFQGNYRHISFLLFDTRGTKVMEKEISDNQFLKMDELTPGIYFYNLVTDQSRQNGRLIKY